MLGNFYSIVASELGQSETGVSPVPGHDVFVRPAAVQGDMIAVSNQTGKVRRLAVGEHQFNFRVRNAKALDHILHGGRYEKLLLQGPVPLMRREVIVQFGVEANRGAGRIVDHTGLTAGTTFAPRGSHRDAAHPLRNIIACDDTTPEPR
jgi:hypothetical protein